MSSHTADPRLAAKVLVGLATSTGVTGPLPGLPRLRPGSEIMDRRARRQWVFRLSSGACLRYSGLGGLDRLGGDPLGRFRHLGQHGHAEPDQRGRASRPSSPVSGRQVPNYAQSAGFQVVTNKARGRYPWEPELSVTASLPVPGASPRAASGRGRVGGRRRAGYAFVGRVRGAALACSASCRPPTPSTCPSPRPAVNGPGFPISSSTGQGFPVPAGLRAHRGIPGDLARRPGSAGAVPGSHAARRGTTDSPIFPLPFLPSRCARRLSQRPGLALHARPAYQPLAFCALRRSTIPAWPRRSPRRTCLPSSR